MPKNDSWVIPIKNFLGGFSPGYWRNEFPSFGNKNQAGKMQNVDLFDPTVLTQGAGIATLTNGDDNSAVTTLIKGLMDWEDGDAAFGVGGNQLYKIQETTVLNAGIWPHTIDKAAVDTELGEDVVDYQGEIFYTYNHDNAAGGDVGKYDGVTTFDDDWGSTVPTGAAALKGGVPHPLCRGGNDFLYIANGNLVTSYGLNPDTDVMTFTEEDLNLPEEHEIQDMVWSSNKLWILTNVVNETAASRSSMSIFLWDGNSDSWDDEVKLVGKGGALFIKNGMLFILSTNNEKNDVYNLSYLEGNSLHRVAEFQGSLPKYYQVTEYQDRIMFLSDDKLYTWGFLLEEYPAMLFQFADVGMSTGGGLAAPFGIPLAASMSGSSYKIISLSGYEVNANWKSLQFDLGGDGRYSYLEKLIVNYQSPGTSAKVDITLNINEGQRSWTDSISRAVDLQTTQKTFDLSEARVENARLELDWSNGSATNPLKIKSIKLIGHYTTDK